MGEQQTSTLSAKQLADRDGPEGFIGGSEIATLAGHGYGSIIDLWRRKTRRTGPLEENRRMTWGNVLEAPIAALYAREQKVSIFRPGTMRHPEHPFIGATPDRIVIPNHKARARKDWLRTLQVKTRGLRRADDYAEGGYPMSDYDQVQWELIVTGLQRGDLVALVGGQEDHLRIIEADTAYQAGLISIAEDFWKNYILTDREPAPDGSDDYSQHLRSRFPGPKKDVLLEPTDVTIGLRDQYVEASEQMDVAEQQKELVKQQLMAIIGDAQGIEDVATWKPTKGKTSIDWDAAFKRAAEEAGLTEEDQLKILKQNTSTAPPGRTFRIAKQKNQ